MKKRYQIDREKAVRRFESQAAGAIMRSNSMYR